MEGYTLAVDGSTYAGSVAVIHGNEVVAEGTLPDSAIPARGQRGEDFMPMVAACLDQAGVSASVLSRVVCGAGPGSFTSLRIAASIAKGIASGVRCPLFAVSSLLLIPAGSNDGPGRYLAVLPAMRDESFVVEVESEDGGVLSVVGPLRIALTLEVPKLAAASGLIAIGSGFGNDARPHARGVAKMIDRIVAGGQCDLNTWEPVYGRLAEAQVKWETAHGRPLAVDT